MSKDSKLAVSQEWIDWVNWFFACFWIGVVENEHGVLVCGSLKYALSQEWVYELSLFLQADSDSDCLDW